MLVDELCQCKTEECRFLDRLHVSMSKLSDRRSFEWFEDFASRAKDPKENKDMFHGLMIYKDKPGWKTEFYGDGFMNVALKDFRPDGTLHSISLVRWFDISC